MYRKFNLKSNVWHKPDVEFEIDLDAGELQGNDADLVRMVLKDAMQGHEIISHPYPTAYEITDPFKSLPDLAIVLGQYWMLDDALQAALPMEEDDEPATITDENGQDIQLQILH